MSQFQRRESELIHQGHVVGFFRETFDTPDGSEMMRDVIRHPGAVTIVPLHSDGTLTMIRQFRAAINRDLLEFPAGKIDPGELDLAQVARRELIEEVGLDPQSLTPLISFLNSPGFCDELNHIYLATDLVEVPRSVQGPEEEAMEVINMSFEEAEHLVSTGELNDAKSVLGLLLAGRAVHR